MGIGDLLDLRSHSWKAELQPSGRVIVVKISVEDAGIEVTGHLLSGEMAFSSTCHVEDATLFDLREKIAQELSWNQGVELLDQLFLRKIRLHHSLAAYSDIVAKELQWKASSDGTTIGGADDIRDARAHYDDLSLVDSVSMTTSEWKEQCREDSQRLRAAVSSSDSDAVPVPA